MSGLRPADHAGLTDVERELQGLGDVAVRIGDHHVGERKVDRGDVVGRLQHGVDRGRGLGDGDEVLGGHEGHHGLAVVVELGGGAVAGRDHPQLVGPLQGDVGPRRVHEGRAGAARALVGDHRGEAHRAGRGQAGARRLQDLDRLRLERGRVTRRRLLRRRRRRLLGAARRQRQGARRTRRAASSPAIGAVLITPLAERSDRGACPVTLMGSCRTRTSCWRPARRSG